MNKRFITTAILLLMFVHTSIAQKVTVPKTLPKPSTTKKRNSRPPGLPIDKGIYILLLSGIFYGIKSVNLCSKKDSKKISA